MSCKYCDNEVKDEGDVCSECQIDEAEYWTDIRQDNDMSVGFYITVTGKKHTESIDEKEAVGR